MTYRGKRGIDNNGIYHINTDSVIQYHHTDMFAEIEK